MILIIEKSQVKNAMNWSLLSNTSILISLSLQSFRKAFDAMLLIRLSALSTLTTFVLALFVFGTGLVYAESPGTIDNVTVTTKVSSLSIPIGGTASYGASVSCAPNPAKEWQVVPNSVTYSWSASLGTPKPKDTSETIVTTDALSQAQVYTSTVTCTVSYLFQKSDPGQLDDGEVAIVSGVNSNQAQGNQVKITAVGIAKVQYNDPVNGWTDTSGTIGVLLGTSIQFRALPNPSSASFPSGYPVWSGTAGASGTGPTTTVNFAVASTSETDYKTVTATCSKIVGDKGVTVNVIVTNLKLKQLSFSGTGSHTVINDLDGSAYSAPQWQDNTATLMGLADQPGDKNYPLCYTQGTTASVSVLLVPYPAIPAGSALLTTSGQVKVVGYAAGTAPYGMSGTVATVASTGVSVSNIPLSAAFPPTVYCYKAPPIQIQWSYTGDNGATPYLTAGLTAHKVYVTLADPLSTASLFQTVLETGCVAAQGASQAAAAVPKIWAGFVGPIPGVKRADLTPMQYWGTFAYNNVVKTTAGLLNHADGRCDSWANFMVDVLGAQGITGTISYIYPTYAPPPPASTIPAGWIYQRNAIIVPVSHAGQNNATPTEHIFNLHVVTKVTGMPGLSNTATIPPSSSPYTTIYDPSYAYIAGLSTLQASEQKWQDDSLYGYRWFYQDQNNNPQHRDTQERNNVPEVTFNDAERKPPP